MDSDFLNGGIAIIETHLSDSNLAVNFFAKNLNLSKSSLYRKLKSISNLSPNEFIRNIRLKRGCKMVKSPSVSITDVAYGVGFTDPKYSSSCFKANFDFTPSEFQKLKQ